MEANLRQKRSSVQHLTSFTSCALYNLYTGVGENALMTVWIALRDFFQKWNSSSPAFRGREIVKPHTRTKEQKLFEAIKESMWQTNTLPWSWCQHWAGWKERSCLSGPVWSLCKLCPKSWEEGRAGRGVHSPSPGLRPTLFLCDRKKNN